MAYQSVTFQPGTLIIPMDTISQDNGMYRAYGLIFKLLYNNVINPGTPIYVYWAINPTKTNFSTVDFIASVREFGTANVPANYSYTGGPFIIEITPQNQALVEQIINDWNSADPDPPAVFIHELVGSAVTVQTAAKLIRPPRVSVEDKNNGIVTEYLDVAGIPDYYTVFPNNYTIPPEWDDKESPSILTSEQIDAGGFFGNTADLNCRKRAYDIFISPHTGEDVWTDLGNTLPQLDQFLQLGGHLHSMCESIVSIENNAYFLTSTGIKEENKGEDFFINQSEAENPLLQAVDTGEVQGLPGGSVQTWNMDETGNNPVNYLPATKIFSYFTETKDDVTTQYDFMIGGPYQGSTYSPNNPGAGAIVYEGGHSYDSKVPYTDKMSNLYYKFVLNSIFLSVTKPLLDLSFTPNAITAGSTNNYDFTVKNIGGGEAINSNISVTLLPNMNPSNYSTPPTSITGTLPTGFTLTWSGITLDAGEEITFDVLNYTAPGSPGDYPIGFTATYGDDFFSTPQNPLTLNTCTSLVVIPSDSPFLLVDKQVDGNLQTSIEEGGTVTFTYTVTNVGDQPAYDIELVDPNLFDFFTFTILDVTPTASFIDTINKKIIFPSGLLGLVIPAAPGPGNVLTITVNATHNAAVPPTQIINNATVNYVNNFDPQQPLQLTSPESNGATTNIVVPDIEALKSVDKLDAAIGDILTYTIEITNPGNTVINSVTVADTIPAGTSYVTNSLNVAANIPIITTVIQTSPQIQVQVDGNLNPISTDPDVQTDRITITFQVRVNSIVSNPVTNTATVDYIYEIGPQETGTETEDSNTVETNIASIIVTKSVPQAVQLGENLVYTIAINNNGEVPLQNVVINDTIPNETSFVSATANGANIIAQIINNKDITLVLDLILVNSTVTIDITVSVNILPPDPYEIDNIAIVTFTVDQEEKPSVPSNEVITIVGDGSILVDKGTEGDISNTRVGDTVTYSIVVTNTGNTQVTLTTLTDVIQQAANTSFQDNFTIGGVPLVPQPVSLNNVDLTTASPLNILDPQESTIITYDVRIDSLPQDEKIDDTVTIDFDYQIGQERRTGEGEDSYIVDIQTPDIDALKSVDRINAVVGDRLTYIVEITNPGTVNIDSVLFTDTIPTGTSYVTNSLNVTANIPIVTNIIQTTPQIIVRVNGQLKPITDTIIIEFQVQVDSIVSNPIQNVGTVDFDYTLNPGGPIITETEDTNIVETNIASVIVTKVGPQFVELGENFVYTISVENDGIVPLQNVVVQDIIPNETSFVSATAIGGNIVSQTVIGKEITLVIDSILPGNTVDIDITVFVDALPPEPYEIDNSANVILTVEGEEKPPVPSNEVTSIVQEGEISVTKGTLGNIQYAKVGDTVTYTVDIVNIGNIPVTLTTLTDVIQQAANTSFQDDFRIDGILVFPQPLNLNNVVLNKILQPQTSTSITYNIRIESLPQGKIIDNTVTIDFEYQIGQQRKTGEREDSFTLNVEEIEVNLIKEVDKDFAEPGEELTYTFTIENQSSIPITDVYLYDPLPPNTTFIEGSFSLNPGENPTIFPGAFIGTILSNSQVVASFRVRVDPDLTSAVNIPNEGSVTYNFKLNPNEPGPGQPGGPENSNVVHTQVEIAEIALMKSVSDEFAEVGDIITYTVTVENTGTVDAHDVEVIDILSSDLQFVPGTLVITPQQPGDTVTGTNPSYVKISIVRANPNVATIQFDAEVINRPLSGNIANIAHGNFKYSLDPQQPPNLSKTDIPSNEVTTTIEQIEVELLKTANNTFVEVGQNLTYTVQITNKSTVPVDIKFTDTLPVVTEYVTGSFNLISGAATVTNNTLPNAMLIDVDIDDMAPQSSVIFSYKVKVLTLPLPPLPYEITNAAKAVPFYSLYPGGPIREGDPVEDEVTTEVKLIKIDVIKAVDEAVATIGDILHYTVTIINNGNTIAENVVFSDNVPDGTEFVEGSLTVDGVTVDSSPETGVDIGSILPGEIVIIKFNVEVVAIPEPPNEPKVENIALVTFDVELDGVLQPRDPALSNPVETELLRVGLEAIKTVDKESANVGDILTYTVVVTNTGDVTIDNVIFSDIIPEGTILVGNQPVQNVNLGSIEPGESKTVIFQVKIIAKICPPKLINKATINGSFIIETSRRINIESNEAITYVDVRMFKQFSVDENLTIPSQKPDMEDILEVIVDVEITYTNVIKTSVVKSYEGQILTGWKLIVEGKLKQKIVYIADEPTQSVHAAEFDVPFSTFIVLPENYMKCMKLKVEGKIEDVFIRKIDERRIFKNVTLFLEARKGC
ncbi:DUF7507 domain-containing protein [Clostridium sp. DL1XJH146]